MRVPTILLLTALVAAGLAGCASPPGDAAPLDPAPPAFRSEHFQGDPSQGTPTGTAGSHGAPQRDDGIVESGLGSPLQFPGAWARRTVTIENDFGGAAQGLVFAGLDAGSITIRAGDGDNYQLQATLEASGFTEQDARDALDRIDLAHDDVMEPDGLRLTTVVKQRPAQQVLPMVNINVGGWVWVDLILTLPQGPAYDLAADASFGEIDVSGLRGPSFVLTASSGAILVEDLHADEIHLDTSSGDIDLSTLKVGDLQASLSSGSLTGTDLLVRQASIDVSSGSIDLEGVFDELDVESSSGSIDVEAYALATGTYALSSSSGDVRLRLLTSPERAYHVVADSSSGDVEVVLRDGETLDEDDDHAEVVSNGFAGAPIRTMVEIETSSGSIDVRDRPIGAPDDDEDDEEDDGEDEHNHGG